MSEQFVGSREPRIDGRDKVSGAAQFVDDLEFGPDLLHAAVVESPHAHARILDIDTAGAAAMPGSSRWSPGPTSRSPSGCT